MMSHSSTTVPVTKKVGHTVNRHISKIVYHLRTIRRQLTYSDILLGLFIDPVHYNNQ